jgi:hypothetical protein
VANTGSLVIVTQFIVDKIKAARVSLGMPTDVENVIYGDQEQIPFNPYICVEPDNKRRTINGVKRRAEVDFAIGVLIYMGDITDPLSNRKDADTLAEAVEVVIDADARFGTPPNDLVIHSFNESIESGYNRKGNSILRTSRLSVTAKSQIILPPSP